MSDTPNNQVTDVAKQKPKLVIFDDSAALLACFTENFTKLGYEVIPVYVSDGNPNDNLDYYIANGKFKRGIPQPISFESYRDEKDAPMPAPEDTLDTEMARLERKMKTSSDRHTSAHDHLKALSAFPYAVKSEEDVVKILKEVKPDLVLSDLSMRKPDAEGPKMTAEEQAADPDIVMGTDIMRIAGQLFPEIPKAIHSGEYTPYSFMGKLVLADKKAKLIAANEIGKKASYLVVPKGIETGTDEAIAESVARSNNKVKAYFDLKLGRGEGHFPD